MLMDLHMIKENFTHKVKTYNDGILLADQIKETLQLVDYDQDQLIEIMKIIDTLKIGTK